MSVKTRIAIIGVTVLALITTGFASASIPGPSGVIKACYRTSSGLFQPPLGTVRIIDSNASCGSGETEISWNQTGPQGPTGPTGATGDTGAQGNTGAQGVQGPIGQSGPAGANGSNGQDGQDGVDGENGADGAPGANGADGVDGAAGPVGPQGDQGMVGATGAVGPAGPAGPVGPDGETGPAGSQGETGADGSQGPQGDTGAMGPQGATGPQGPVGATGVVGPQGPQGVPGIPGAQGPAGPAGSAGANGVLGYDSSLMFTQGATPRPAGVWNEVGRVTLTSGTWHLLGTSNNFGGGACELSNMPGGLATPVGRADSNPIPGPAGVAVQAIVSVTTITDYLLNCSTNNGFFSWSTLTAIQLS